MKKILLSVGVTAVVAGITFGALYFINVNKTTSAPTTATTDSNKLVLDHSKDYGACTLLDISAIKTALGEAAANLQAPVNTGITGDTYFGDDVKNIVSDSQTCVYAFASGGTTDKTVGAANGLSVKQTVYTNPDGPKALIEQTKQVPEAIPIASLGDAAFYIADTSAGGPDATASFTLIVFNSSKSTSYTIIQPAKSTTFTTESAKTALLLLAKV